MATSEEQKPKGFVNRVPERTLQYKEAYKNNSPIYVPGYGTVKNFRDFFEGLDTDQSIDQFIRQAKLAPEIDIYYENIQKDAIKGRYDAGGMVNSTSEAVPENERFRDYVGEPPTQDERFRDYVEEPPAQEKLPVGPDPYARSAKPSTTFGEKFRDYVGQVAKDTIRAGVNYNLAIEKQQELRSKVFPTFKDAYTFHRRQAIDKGTLYKEEGNFRWTNPETGEEKLYHPRSLAEQEKYLKKTRKNA